MAYTRKVLHSSGVQKWQATITTSEGKRKAKNFDRKADADAWARKNDKASATGAADMTLKGLALAHNRWFDGLVREGERGQITLDRYDSHLDLHLAAQPAVSGKRLSEITAPDLQGFLDTMVAAGATVETARRVKKSLSAWCKFGVRNGHLVINPVEAITVIKKRRKKVDLKLPAKEKLTALLGAAAGGSCHERDDAVVRMLMFGGFRISELLGSADDAIELKRAGAVLSVTERLCTRHVTLGPVKSDEGLRDVPLGPSTAAAVRAWRIRRGVSSSFIHQGQRVSGRLFPGREGTWAYQDWWRGCWRPMMARAGLASQAKNAKGVKRWTVEFGPHALRHVYASIQIENGVTPKRLQGLLGHSTLAMTMDLYGHLWTDPVGDEAMAAAAERSIPESARERK